MRLSRLCLRNLAAFRRKSRALYRLSVTFGALAVVLLSLGGQSENSTKALLSAVALRTVELQSNGTAGTSLTSSGVSAIRSIGAVAKVYPVITASASTKTRSAGFVFYPTSYIPIFNPPIVAATRKSVFPLKPGEIVLPSSAMGATTQEVLSLLGRSIPIAVTVPTGVGTGTAAIHTARVVGVYNSSWQLAGHAAALVSQPDALAWASETAGTSAGNYLAKSGYSMVYVVAKSSAEVQPLLTTFSSNGYYATSVLQSVAGEPGILSAANVVGKAVAVGLGVLLFAFAYALIGAQLRTRTRELATLRALGLDRLKISSLLSGELVLRGIECALLAVVGGAGISAAAMWLIRSQVKGLAAFIHNGYAPPAVIVAAVAGLVGAGVILGGVIPIFKALRLEPSDGLRDV